MLICCILPLPLVRTYSSLYTVLASSWPYPVYKLYSVDMFRSDYITNMLISCGDWRRTETGKAK